LAKTGNLRPTISRRTQHASSAKPREKIATTTRPQFPKPSPGFFQEDGDQTDHDQSIAAKNKGGKKILLIPIGIMYFYKE
jgi:hypothetical protein